MESSSAREIHVRISPVATNDPGRSNDRESLVRMYRDSLRQTSQQEVCDYAHARGRLLPYAPASRIQFLVRPGGGRYPGSEERVAQVNTDNTHVDAEWIPFNTAMQHLQCSERTLYRLIQQGKIRKKPLPRSGRKAGTVVNVRDVAAVCGLDFVTRTPPGHVPAVGSPGNPMWIELPAGCSIRIVVQCTCDPNGSGTKMKPRIGG